MSHAHDDRVAQLFDMLDQFDASDGSERESIGAEIDRRFGVESAVMVLDMSGFSLQVQRYGILHYLALIRRMQKVAGPLVQDNGGEVVKFDADNMFAVFPTLRDGIDCALHVRSELERGNRDVPEHRHVHISVGLAYGRIILVPERDFFGDPVNLASKLGEDLAAGGELLVERQAFENEALDLVYRSEPAEFAISGLRLRAVQVLGAKSPDSD